MLYRLRETLAEVNTRRTKRVIVSQNNPEIGWEGMDNKKFIYMHTEIAKESAFPIFKARPTAAAPITLLSIFLAIINESLIQNMLLKIQTVNPNVWTIGYGKHVKISTKLIYLMYAVKIRIIGLQNKSTENEAKQRPLRDSVTEALCHFNDISSGFVSPVRNCVYPCDKMERMMSRLKLDETHFAELSLNFQSLLTCPGEFVAGDEKLLHYTGNSGDIMKVPSKPDTIGLWF